MTGYTERFASNNMLSFATFIISFFFTPKKTNKLSSKARNRRFISNVRCGIRTHAHNCGPEHFTNFRNMP